MAPFSIGSSLVFVQPMSSNICGSDACNGAGGVEVRLSILRVAGNYFDSWYHHDSMEVVLTR